MLLEGQLASSLASDLHADRSHQACISRRYISQLICCHAVQFASCNVLGRSGQEPEGIIVDRKQYLP